MKHAKYFLPRIFNSWKFFAKLVRRKLDYVKNEQPKYFSGENSSPARVYREPRTVINVINLIISTWLAFEGRAVFSAPIVSGFWAQHLFVRVLGRCCCRGSALSATWKLQPHANFSVHYCFRCLDCSSLPTSRGTTIHVMNNDNNRPPACLYMY